MGSVTSVLIVWRTSQAPTKEFSMSWYDAGKIGTPQSTYCCRISEIICSFKVANWDWPLSWRARSSFDLSVIISLVALYSRYNWYSFASTQQIRTKANVSKIQVWKQKYKLSYQDFGSNKRFCKHYLGHTYFSGNVILKNCSICNSNHSDLKKSFPWLLEQFFLTVAQNNFGYKIPFLVKVLYQSFIHLFLNIWWIAYSNFWCDTSFNPLISLSTRKLDWTYYLHKDR